MRLGGSSIAWVLVLLVAAGTAGPLWAQAAAGLKQNLDLPFDAAGDEEEEEDAPEIIVFYGQQYEGDGIFFSCDKSGSMREGGKWQRLQREVIKNISQFSERVQFGIVFFDGQVVKFPQSGRPADATPAMKAAATSMIMTVQLGRGTCSKAALFQCLNFAHQSSAKRKVIIHLSDGLQRCPGYDNTQYARDCLTEVCQRNTQRVKINTICLGPPNEVDEAWMRSLAAQNGGSYARIVQ